MLLQPVIGKPDAQGGWIVEPGIAHPFRRSEWVQREAYRARAPVCVRLRPVAEIQLSLDLGLAEGGTIYHRQAIEGKTVSIPNEGPLTTGDGNSLKKIQGARPRETYREVWHFEAGSIVELPVLPAAWLLTQFPYLLEEVEQDTTPAKSGKAK